MKINLNAGDLIDIFDVVNGELVREEAWVIESLNTYEKESGRELWQVVLKNDPDMKLVMRWVVVEKDVLEQIYDMMSVYA